MENISLLNYLQKTKAVSRRDFVDMIKEEAVFINNELVLDINKKVNIGDILTVKISEKEVYEEKITKIPSFKPVIVAFNKPKGYVVSKNDKHNKTIYSLLPKSWHKDFYYIGRLDKESHGLLLLTNSPHLVDFYENPKNKIIKIYEVKINKQLKTNHISKLKKGNMLDKDGNIDNKNGELLSFYDIHKIKDKYDNEFLRILLKEGKNRHIRRLLKSVGYEVTDLKRVKVGKYELGNIKLGKYMIHKSKDTKKTYGKKEYTKNILLF
ncbi:pseudouridine synthase [Candidatus Vampirococcus lugosii]|uniref:Pseudouridine synthase n=1 Tax=Candidatus Vampirococcus lugosii TaxID=2789015 RepID=A0ABS5QLZ8_9BACT|nr:pseudouridine synthase [Candidatus Vampirococcus lugosii]MBS8122099.1 Ribosomal large subunit pseudouridine synthase B [Candidatus Vampirococcus lugosii]